MYNTHYLSKSCLHLLRGHREQETVFNLLVEAGDASWARGAHEVGQQIHRVYRTDIEFFGQLALQSFESARLIFSENYWVTCWGPTLDVLSKIAA